MSEVTEQNEFRIDPASVPKGSVLGLNYSGMHDTAIAIVAPDGTPVFAVSLERISRRKQDGRWPTPLLAKIPWDRISKVGISVKETYIPEMDFLSKTHPKPFPTPYTHSLAHGEPFPQALADIPVEKVFVPHHLCHAESSFWSSGFKESLCLVYDGGMSNEGSFGGVYNASLDKGVEALDHFSALHYANVAFLYTAVTAVLGFSPSKHEGKITGLAAYGKPTAACRELLESWWLAPDNFVHLHEWHNMYSNGFAPSLDVNPAFVEALRPTFEGFSKEEMAATVQAMAEDHVKDILAGIRTQGWMGKNICLSGGLFANVKINQRVNEAGYDNVFVAPPMTDDGTALGAAWRLVSKQNRIYPGPVKNMYLGPAFSVDQNFIERKGIKFLVPDDPADYIASQLVGGAIVAVFQGASEYGPRALGNRSILALATDHDINQQLNKRLSRTEFMPFAPIILAEDADKYFLMSDGISHTSRFMTITVNCNDKAKRECPAVVHVDGTARPQLVEHGDNNLIYDVLSRYRERSGKFALVNTSFNVHEEPIVCSPEDALRGFFEAGLDILYLEGFIIRLEDNRETEVNYLRNKVTAQNALIKSMKQAQIAQAVTAETCESDVDWKPQSVFSRKLSECKTQIKKLLE